MAARTLHAREGLAWRGTAAVTESAAKAGPASQHDLPPSGTSGRPGGALWDLILWIDRELKALKRAQDDDAGRRADDRIAAGENPF
jgi:hypothetical protein